MIHLSGNMVDHINYLLFLHRKLVTAIVYNGSLQSKATPQKTEYYLFNTYNQMKAYSDNGESYGYYGYDASGERIYKLVLNTTINNANTYPNTKNLEVEKLMLYPNGYINIDQDGNYTKHYYAGDQRIASKIGSEYKQGFPTVYSDTLGLFMIKEELGKVVIPNDTIGNIDYPFGDICKLAGDTNSYENELYFYHGDHLSSTQMVTDLTGGIMQQVLYAPFGEVITEYNAYWNNGKVPDFMYNGKELDEENGMYYYSARYYNPPTFISRDPLFEKYPTLSPYNYCANNPLIFIDPDGRTIKIYFTETSSKGKTIHKAFFFNGNNQHKAPKNSFVQNFLSAYNYNTKNGGGEKMKEAATSTEYTIFLIESADKSYATTVFVGAEGNERQEIAVYWNPNKGLKTTDGYTLSPATALEEEFDQATDQATDSVGHTNRYDTPDKQYGNAEERRAKQNSTKRTAIRNKEVPANWKGEQNYNGKGVIRDKWEYQDENH